MNSTQWTDYSFEICLAEQVAQRHLEVETILFEISKYILLQNISTIGLGDQFGDTVLLKMIQLWRKII